MIETLKLEVTTHVFGLGNGRAAEPIYLVLPQRDTTARTLIAQHVRAEVQRANTTRTSSLALHYLLADDLHHTPLPRSSPTLVDNAEITRAYTGLAERRYLLVVDGVAVSELDAPLALTDRSAVGFVRLLPLIGG